MTQGTPERLPSLDLSAPGTPAAGRPQPAAGDALPTLAPPAPVTRVDAAATSQVAPVDPAKRAVLEGNAVSFVAGLAGLDPRAPEFGERLKAIRTMAAGEIRTSSAMSQRLLDRSTRAQRAAAGGDPRTVVAQRMTDLKRILDDLDPKRATQSQGGLFRGRGGAAAYAKAYDSAQAALNSVVLGLKDGREELLRDNLALEDDQKDAWASIGRLQEYAALIARLDTEVDAMIAAEPDPQRADLLRRELQFAVRQKHQDLLTQLAVAVQGYLALDLVRSMNTELMAGVDRTTSTTLAALRTALAVATARDQSAATASGLAAVDGQVDAAYDALDRIDRYRAQADDSLAQTVRSFGAHLADARQAGPLGD